MVCHHGDVPGTNDFQGGAQVSIRIHVHRAALRQSLPLALTIQVHPSLCSWSDAECESLLQTPYLDLEISPYRKKSVFFWLCVPGGKS